MLNTLVKSKTLFILILSICLISACQKDEATRAIIIVKDSNGVRLNAANVWIYPDASQIPSNLDLVDEMSQLGITDSDGSKEFEFPNEAILKVEAAKQSGNDYLSGENVIRLLKGKTVTKIVEIN